MGVLFNELSALYGSLFAWGEDPLPKRQCNTQIMRCGSGMEEREVLKQQGEYWKAHWGYTGAFGIANGSCASGNNRIIRGFHRR